MTSHVFSLNEFDSSANASNDYDKRHQMVHSKRCSQDNTFESAHAQSIHSHDIDSLSSSAVQGNSPADTFNNAEPLRVHVERAVRDYFAALGGEMPIDLYELILAQVELPLLTVVLEQTRGNQTKCAQVLGLNRGTLRKKLKTYDLM